MKKVIYTAGVFDLFHLGHLNLIKTAKDLGNHLIVGVSTDELVYQYKGYFPVVPFYERKEIVNSIKWVDEVVPQTDRNKFLAWELLGFDIWVVGDDWFGDPYYMDLKCQFESVGVETVFLPYTKNVSSSLRIKEICEKQPRSEQKCQIKY
ncbi:MAG TPA: adenylyltransferase/cytidyltransferase family protein [Bacillus bacterium]|nr:adenylyltransferase/cytidyltransferase family protein [Bacillus sp. (in: firmicutes)]